MHRNSPRAHSCWCAGWGHFEFVTVCNNGLFIPSSKLARPPRACQKARRIHDRANTTAFLLPVLLMLRPTCLSWRAMFWPVHTGCTPTWPGTHHTTPHLTTPHHVRCIRTSATYSDPPSHPHQRFSQDTGRQCTRAVHQTCQVLLSLLFPTPLHC